MLTLLSAGDRARIHETGLRILEEIGVRIHHRGVAGKLLDAGALPDPKDNTKLFFPRQLVREKLALCPRSFRLKDRRGVETMVESGGSPLYYTANAITYARGTYRKVSEIGTAEFVEFARVIDRLDNVHGMVGTGIRDYAPQARDFAGFHLMARHTGKHLRPCIYTPSGAVAILEMADAILGGKPLRENMFFTLGYSIVSPLTWSETAMELFERTSGYGIPLMINSEPMAGGTSPVTLAGCLAQADAEVLSGIVINQVLEPGRPCLYNAGFAHVLDMRTAIVLTGAPENALLQSAGAEMAQFHGLPCASWALSDAPVLDSQASYEKLFTLLSHTLSRVNMVWGVGNLETSKTISPEAAVIDNELIGCCQRFERGIQVDEERLAYGVIREAAGHGSFLGTDHTLEHFRQELYSSPLPNRVQRASWERDGSRPIEEKAAGVVQKILAEPVTEYLTGSQAEKLEKIEKAWLERLAK